MGGARFLLLSLALVAPLAACSDRAGPVPAPPDGAAAEAPDAATEPNGPSPGPPAAVEPAAAVDTGPSGFPRAAIGTVTMTLAGRTQRELGRGFLTRRAGVPVLATARHLAGPGGGLSTELELARYELDVASAVLHLADGDVALGAPACAALDHWTSDVLLLAAPDADPGAAIAPAARGPRVGDATLMLLGEALTAVAATVVEVYDDAFFELELAAGTPSALLADVAGLPVLDASGAALGVISETRPLGGGRRGIAAQALAPFLSAPERLPGHPLAPLVDYVEQADLSADGTLLAVGAPTFGRLQVFDRQRGEVSAPLEALDRGRRLSIAAFTADGYTLLAAGRGRVELYELQSGIPLAVLEDLAGSPRALATGGGRAAVATTEETVVLDLDTFRPLARFPAATAVAATGDGGFLAGAEDGAVERFDVALALDGSGDARPARTPVVGASGRPVLAVAATDEAYAIGRGTQVLVVARGGGAAPLARLATGAGSVNALAAGADGALLLVGTGQLLEDDAGDLVAADCYVRVFDARSWREVARSHDHWSPVVALLPAGADRWLSVCADGETYEWNLAGLSPAGDPPSGR